MGNGREDGAEGVEDTCTILIYTYCTSCTGICFSSACLNKEIDGAPAFVLLAAGAVLEHPTAYCWRSFERAPFRELEPIRLE
jgi:hypothetical protein